MAASVTPLRERDKDETARVDKATADLVRLIEDEIASGITFENDEKIGAATVRNRKGARDAMLDYYDGVMDDLPAEAGRSSVVSRDVADVTDTMLPGLMRVFAGADKVAVFGPSRPGDEEIAAQATDYINHVWMNECGGYAITATWIKDALDVRNGIVKAYWDDTPEHETEDLRGLDENQITTLLSDPEVELIGADERQQIIRDPATGRSVALPVYDVRVKRVSSNGRLVVENVPPDDFGISRGARSIATARAVWHRSRMTRSDLVKQGYPRDLVDDLPAYGSTSRRSDADRNDEDDTFGTTAGETGATAEVEVIEAYVRFDFDDDGIAEMRKVVIAGLSGNREPLSNEPWSDDAPFVDMTPQPVPHRWMGRSVGDNTMDLQRVKTALMRGALDNVYAQNLPDRIVNEDAIVDPDEVRTRAFGNLIRIKKAYAPGQAIQDITTPNVAANILEAISYVDSVLQRRTGVSNATASLDSTALDPQTATAATIEHDASYARVEMIARNMAELGFKPLFAKLLRILVRNQDRPKTIRLRDQWVDFDPSGWNASMDVTINVGLGTGSRERDLAMLTGVAARQEAIIQKLGPKNPIVTPSRYVGTLHKIVEASGLRDPDTYFAPVTDAEYEQWQKQQAAENPPQPDPKVQAIQAKSQADQQALQARTQGEQQRLQADIALKQQAGAAEMQNHRDKLEADLQAQREKLDAEAQLERDRLERDFALRTREMELEADLKRQALVAGLHMGGQTNIARQG